jgi:hypothetical protein|tara:strand:- start:3713 stop:3895 length:183 start_codon:yes stop_codon:yes gene_type:complete
MGRRNSILIKAQAVTVTPSTVGSAKESSVDIVIREPTKETLVRLIAESSRLLEWLERRAE